MRAIPTLYFTQKYLRSETCNDRSLLVRGAASCPEHCDHTARRRHNQSVNTNITHSLHISKHLNIRAREVRLPRHKEKLLFQADVGLHFKLTARNSTRALKS